MTLRSLLDAGARFDAEYRGGLSNHLPMALTALSRLGADDARLERFAAGYAARLEAAPAGERWPAGDAWTGRFGDRAAWTAYRDLFRQWLQAEGAQSVLRQALPALMPGCGAAAFHGPIRAAAGMRAAHGGELADGLAYWACRWLDLGGVDGDGTGVGPAPGGRLARGRSPGPTDADLHDAPDDTRAAGGTAGAGADDTGAAAPARRRQAATLLRRLRSPPPREGLIFERMRDAAAQAGHDAVVGALRIDAATLGTLARLAARHYARSGDFTLLHLVTASHAVRVLMAFVDAPLPAVGWFWRAYAAAHAASGAVIAGPAPQPLAWPALVEAALASDDEHVIKLVDACREEQAAWGGADDWQRAATRAVVVQRGG